MLAGILTPPLRIDSASEQEHLYLCQKRGQEHCTGQDEGRFVSRTVSWLGRDEKRRGERRGEETR